MRIVMLAVVLLSGCAVTSEKAGRVQVHTQISSLLTDCQRLGPVTGSSRILEADIREHAALNALREATADVGGDSVAVINTDNRYIHTTIHGVALKCFP